MAASACQCLPVPASAFQYLPVPASACQCLLVPASACQYLLVPASAYQCLPVPAHLLLHKRLFRFIVSLHPDDDRETASRRIPLAADDFLAGWACTFWFCCYRACARVCM